MGIGGGSVLIPSLTYFFGIAQKQAQSTNLISFIPTAITALIVHIKNKRVLYKTALWIIGFGIIGAIIGAVISVVLHQDTLRKIFAVFMCLVGAYEITISFKK